MKTRASFLFFRVSVLLGLTFCVCSLPTPLRADPLSGENGKLAVKLKVPLKAEPFPLEDVRILDGPFRHAMELDQKYLLELNVDRLLHNFRVNAGLPSTAEPLGGWEEPKCELRGHFVGHYLSACALMYASTKDVRFKQKGDAVVAGLAECQAKLGTGYLSAYPENFFDRVEQRKQVWAPYYTLHKIFAGLLDMYVYCDNKQALDIAKKFGDWAIARNSKLTDQQMQEMLQTEHGGMNDSLAELYALTGEKKYLDISMRFNHHRLLDPAERGEDNLTGLHANTQFPKFIGNSLQYELSGQPELFKAVSFFWNTVTKERSYVIGGNSDGEMFSPKERLSQALGPNTTETCNTYNMLKLTRHLFCLDPQPQYADYYERGLFNHILASQNPETGMMCYYVPLKSGSRRNYNGENDSFWCCTGTGVENHAKYGDSIYFHDEKNETLYVNLFIASELNWKAKGLKVLQETKFPDEGSSKLSFTAQKPVNMSIKVRRPYWARSSFEVRVNGKLETISCEPSGYAVVKRKWKTGDSMEIKMPFITRLEGFKDNPDRFAFMNGPLVLAAEVDTHKPLPAIVGSKEAVLASLKPMAAKTNIFEASSKYFRIPAESSGTTVLLRPFYQLYNVHYETYWDRFDEAQWKVKEQEYAVELAEHKMLEARTVDVVNAGEEQNERDHQFKGEQTDVREFNGRAFRFANTNGWFSWELKVLADTPQELSVSLFPSGRGPSAYEIFVDDQKIAAENLQPMRENNGRRQPPTQKVYPLKEEVVKGKEKVVVKFKTPADQRGGNVSSVRILKPGQSQ